MNELDSPSMNLDNTVPGDGRIVTESLPNEVKNRMVLLAPVLALFVSQLSCRDNPEREVIEYFWNEKGLIWEDWILPGAALTLLVLLIKSASSGQQTSQTNLTKHNPIKLATYDDPNDIKVTRNDLGKKIRAEATAAEVQPDKHKNRFPTWKN